MYCTKCGNQVDGSAAFCKKCGAPVYGRGGATNAAVPSASAPGDSSRPKIPGITLAACIILYVLYGGGLLSNLLEAGRTPFGALAGQVGFSLLLIALVICIQKGRNWARIVLTAILGALVFVFVFLTPILAVAYGVVFALPLVFLWLPRSSNWYRAIKACGK